MHSTTASAHPGDEPNASRAGDLFRKYEAGDALSALAGLPPDQRDTLGLLVFGLSYAADVTRTAIRATRHRT